MGLLVKGGILQEEGGRAQRGGGPPLGPVHIWQIVTNIDNSLELEVMGGGLEQVLTVFNFTFFVMTCSAFSFQI